MNNSKQNKRGQRAAAKHTPSFTPEPWEIRSANGGRVISIKSGLVSIARISVTNIDAEANACLIAAAPELLAALKEFLLGGTPGMYERATAAIAKAEGRA
jgi:hypothetical protein